MKKKDTPIVTVFTPTYNRKHTINRLYKSLINQSCKRFIWLIIDDGSSDSTDELISSFIKEDIITIKYIYKKNEGKHIAINLGVDMCDTELFFIVDSDDYLVKDAIKNIICFTNSIEDKNIYCGIAGLKAYQDLKPIASIPIDDKKKYLDANHLEITYKYNVKGDKAEVFFTNVLKKYKFPKFENENFLTECVVWNKMANDGYIIRWFNKIIYIAEYMNDGLTKNSKKLSLANPKGRMYQALINSQCNIPLKEKIRFKINYYRYGLHAKTGINKLIIRSIKNGSIIYFCVGLGKYIEDKLFTRY